MTNRTDPLSAAEIVDLSLRHTLFDWTAQSAVHPIPFDHAKGVEFFTVDGKRYLDFNSQLWSVNIGHGDARVIEAIRSQAEKLPYISPFHTTEVRARLGAKLAELLPGDMEKVFFTLGGAEANENALRMARLATGRHKILARYRSYHGATAGTNGVLIPPDGYLQGVRELCDRYGILMVCDEVMCGFGRTGEWFAVDHWGVVPDLLTMAKGLTSSYVPLGAVAMRPHVARHFHDNVYWGGLTYNSHPLALAAALATIGVYEEDGLIENARRMGEVMRTHHRDLMERHPSVGAARNIGLFGVLELVRDRATMQPMAAFNSTSEEMKAVGAYLDERGLFTFIRWNHVMTNPPLCITEAELAEGFEIIDGALELADRAMDDAR